LDVNAGAAATALSNLLRNAIQHAGSSGSVRASLAVAGDQCVISVHDSGASIPPESVAMALSLAGQLRAKRDSRSRYSYGLGLYSARRAAELAGGSLLVGTAESGSVLELVLPVGGG
jgi:signal transduction histidine kinase